jgi:hypothetical protein
VRREGSDAAALSKHGAADSGAVSADRIRSDAGVASSSKKEGWRVYGKSVVEMKQF